MSGSRPSFFASLPTEPASVFLCKSAALRKVGFNVTLRYSLGDDIAAACGQLAG
ncbi:MAG TPA: hypothetical protein PLE77_00515 [Kiritimatiellia bacterium]|nr:hypothetical protein [Kiritimatiellia bacterium]